MFSHKRRPNAFWLHPFAFDEEQFDILMKESIDSLVKFMQCLVNTSLRMENFV